MGVIVAKRAARTRVRTFEAARRIRRKLIDEGADRYLVMAASVERLPELVREHNARKLRLVPDTSREERMLSEGFTPDEIHSVQTALRGELIEGAFPRAFDADPWDFDGSDAA
jgi:SOS response regulatory protein OraA/RecX